MIAVLRYFSMHSRVNMRDIRSMLSEVLRMFGTSRRSSLQQTWETTLLSMALQQRGSPLLFTGGNNVGNGWAEDGTSHRPSDLSMRTQPHDSIQNGNRPSSMLTCRDSLFAFLSCQV